MSDTTTKTNDTFDELAEKYKANLPKDDLQSKTGLDPSSPEYTHVSDLLAKVQGNNSTKHIISSTKILEIFGWISLILISLAKIFASVFDLKYHFPNMELVLGDGGVTFVGIFIGLLVVTLTHIPMDGLVNDKWKDIPKIVLASLFIIGMSSSLYLDSKAIDNYSRTVVDLLKEKKLDNKNDADSIVLNGVRGKQTGIAVDINRTQSSIITINARLKVIARLKDKIQNDINDYKDTKNQKNAKRSTIKTMNSNIYTSRKQLAGYEAEEIRLDEKLTNLDSKLESKREKLSATVEGESTAMNVLDAKMETEKKKRESIFWMLIIVLELGSFLTIISKYLQNKNLDMSEKDRDEIMQIVSSNEVNKNFTNSLKLTMLQQTSRDNQIGVLGIQAIGEASSINLAGQAKTTQAIINTTLIASNTMQKMSNNIVTQHVTNMQNYNNVIAPNQQIENSPNNMNNNNGKPTVNFKNGGAGNSQKLILDLERLGNTLNFDVSTRINEYIGKDMDTQTIIESLIYESGNHNIKVVKDHGIDRVDIYHDKKLLMSYDIVTNRPDRKHGIDKPGKKVKGISKLKDEVKKAVSSPYTSNDSGDSKPSPKSNKLVVHTQLTGNTVHFRLSENINSYNDINIIVRDIMDDVGLTYEIAEDRAINSIIAYRNSDDSILFEYSLVNDKVEDSKTWNSDNKMVVEKLISMDSCEARLNRSITINDINTLLEELQLNDTIRYVIAIDQDGYALFKYDIKSRKEVKL